MSVNWLNNLFGVNIDALKATLPTEYQPYLDALPIAPSKVSRENLPALRALITQSFPELRNNPQARASIEQVAGQVMGDRLNGYLKSATSMSDYSNQVNAASRDPIIRGNLQLFKKLAERREVKGSTGYNPEATLQSFGNAQPEKPTGAAGKVTLAAHFIQAGAQQLDTTIPKKVESAVTGDLFNYWAPNPERGVYNGMYLNDMQWEKEVRFTEPLQLPRSGDDQLYFQSFQLLPQYENSQPVDMEMMDRFTDQMYAIYAAHDYSWDPLHDKQSSVDPIMDRSMYSEFIPEVTLQGDGKYMYPDPEEPQGPGYMNRVGFKPKNDSWRNPDEKSKFKNVLIMPAQEAFRLAQLNGIAAGVMTT